MIDIRIMASPLRADRVGRLLRKLGIGEEAVTWDDRPNGGDAMYTAGKTWLHPLPEGATHRMVLQDDVDVCAGFADILTQIAGTHPTRVFSGIHFLQPANFPAYNRTPYCRLTNMPGCAIMMPAGLIQPCMDWCNASGDEILRPHDDLMISKYCREHGVMMIGSVPCIVQHPDEDSLFGTVYTWKRYSRLYDERGVGDWTNRSILIPK